MRDRWGAPTSSAGKFIVEMDEGGWMHTYHAAVYEAPNGQRIQFRTSGTPPAPRKHIKKVLPRRPLSFLAHTHARAWRPSRPALAPLAVRSLTASRVRAPCAAVNTASTINTFRVVEEQQAVNQQHAAF